MATRNNTDQSRIIIVLALLIATIGVIGGTLAYFQNTATVNNTFRAQPYSTEITDTFVSPETWIPGTTTDKEVTVKNTGDVDVAVRLSYKEKWTSQNGDELSLTLPNSERAALVNLINTDEIPKKALKYMDAAKLGGRLFSVYLGLNVSCDDLGLDSYNYFIYHSLDSDLEYNRMKDINNGNLIANVLNVANRDASPEGTCILELSTLYFDDCFKNLNNNNYEQIKNNITDQLIDSFEKATKIRIRNYIEEIEVVTPVDVAGVNGSVEGSIFGYQFSGEDNLINRIMCKNDEEYVKGLYLCGGLNGDIYNQCSSYVTGLEAALNIIHDLGGDK